MGIIALWRMYWFRSLVLVGFVFAQEDQLVDRKCPCTLGSLWIDVVVLIDVSAFMGDDKLIQVISNLGSVFLQSRIGPEEGQFTKVGVITYDSTANVVFNMTQIDSTDAFEVIIWTDIIPRAVDDTHSNLNNALQEAQVQLQSVSTKNRRQMILIYAATSQNTGANPIQLADNLKSEGISIMVVSFTQDSQYNDALQGVASTGMLISNTIHDLIETMQMQFCAVNCYCPMEWTQYSNSFGNTQLFYGECIRFGFASALWTPSKYSCQTIHQNGYLATAFNQEKIDYLSSMAQWVPNYPKPHEFFVGLSYSAESWQWEQEQGKNTLKADKSTPWSSGYPTVGVLDSCAQVAPTDVTETKFGLKNVNCNSVSAKYVCQLITCDTDNYCE